MKNLFKNFSGYLAGVVILALVGLNGYTYYNLGTAKFAITELKDSVVTITADRDALRTANASLTKELASAKATKDVVTETKATEVKVEKAGTEASRIVTKRLLDIEAKYAKMAQTEQTAKLKATEISLERAKGIWLTYCLQEPAEKACK